MTGMQSATAAGGAIAQYRLGQAMAAMRLRTDAPAHTLGPAHHRAGRRESYLSSMTIGTASPRRTPRVPPPVSARARAAVFRSESTSSGEWGTFTSDVAELAKDGWIPCDEVEVYVRRVVVFSLF